MDDLKMLRDTEHPPGPSYLYVKHRFFYFLISLPISTQLLLCRLSVRPRKPSGKPVANPPQDCNVHFQCTKHSSLHLTKCRMKENAEYPRWMLASTSLHFLG